MLDLPVDIKKVLQSDSLPDYEYLFDILIQVTSVLDKENTSYRQLASDGETLGGLIEFNDNLPMIVLPDLHARYDFLQNLLTYKIYKKANIPGITKATSVYQALKKGLINVVCVGDAIHTEKNTVLRWEKAHEDFVNGKKTGKYMCQEMKDCFNTLLCLMLLKIKFPEHFHFLKGNHENITNKSENGDFGFRKYADEGRMVRDFIREYYGDDILYLISCYEDALPLIASSPYCVISHAEPLMAFSKQQLIDARLEAKVVESLTWTRNNQAEDGSVLQIIKNLFADKNWNPKNAIYLAGHRPVENKYNLRQNGLFVQFHNPSEQNIAIIYNNRPFNPEEDIIGVEK